MAESPAARVLSRAVDVRSGEVPGLLAAFAYHFLLFTAYYILRPIRDSMGVAGGVENLDDLFGWTLLGMLAAVPLFGWISGRFRRAVFLPWTYLFFVAQLVAFWAVFTASEHYAATARVFFVWVSVFNLFVISVFRSFMADLFDKEQGKRLFAFITAGASVGAMTGSAITSFLAESLGDVNLLLVSAALLASTIALMRFLLGWSGTRAGTGERTQERPIGGTSILAMVYVGLFGVGLAHFLWWAIVGRLPTMTASIGSLLVPVIGVSASAIVLGERLSVPDIIGFAMIFAAAACVLLQPGVQHSEMPE